MAKYKIEIDRETCIGDQLCCGEAPETFDMDEDDKAIVTNPEGNSPEEIVCAAKCCPVDAIKLTDSTTGEVVWPEE